jgi:topoisomerase-4 subunit B
MNPLQLRETTMDPNTRRLVRLTIEDKNAAFSTIDMLLAKNRAADRKQWLTEEGDKAEILE